MNKLTCNISIIAATLGFAIQAIASGGNGGPGGGFLRSDELLQTAETLLAAKIREADPAAFALMPALWTQDSWNPETLAITVENVERHYDRSINGMNDRGILIAKAFDNDQAGKKLLVVKDFLTRYEAQTAKSLIQDAIEQIQIDLLHEFSHLLQIGVVPGADHESETFAIQLFGRLQSCPLRFTRWTQAPGQEDLKLKYESTPVVENIRTLREYLGGPRARGFRMHCKGVEDFSPYTAISGWQVQAGESCSQTFRSWKEDQRFPAPLALVLPEKSKTKEYSQLFTSECIAYQPDTVGLTPITAQAADRDSSVVEKAGRLVGSMRVARDGRVYGKMDRAGENYLPSVEKWCPAVDQPAPMYFECAYDSNEFDPIASGGEYETIGKACFVEVAEEKVEKRTKDENRIVETKDEKHAVQITVVSFDDDAFYYDNPYLAQLKQKGELWRARTLESSGRLLATEESFEKGILQAQGHLKDGTCSSAYRITTTVTTTKPAYPGDKPKKMTEVTGQQISN